jgi:ERF superfamily
MNQHDQSMTTATGKLAAALAKAQAEIKGAKKDAANPFFKSTYADLASVWDACRDALSKNELAVAQPTDFLDGQMILKTILLHSSGETITGLLPIMAGEKATAQQVGSAITYARRYALAAMVGVAPEDDDGNAASTATAKTGYSKPAQNLKDRATRLATDVDAATSEPQLIDIVTKANPLLAEMKQDLPDWCERIMTKITSKQQVFQGAAHAG